MKAIVTGACSRIGSAVIFNLGVLGFAEMEKWCRCSGVNLMDRGTIPKPDRVDLVVHAADLNQVALFNLWGVVGPKLAESGGQFILISTARIYFDDSNYTRDKRAQELTVLDIARYGKVRANIVRPAIKDRYGEPPGEKLTFSSGSHHGVGHVVRWLAETDYITGAAINYDGGRVLNKTHGPIQPKPVEPIQQVCQICGQSIADQGESVCLRCYP